MEGLRPLHLSTHNRASPFLCPVLKSVHHPSPRSTPFSSPSTPAEPPAGGVGLHRRRLPAGVLPAGGNGKDTVKTSAREAADRMAGPGGDKLRLLTTWASPFGLRVQLALAVKGLSYEYIEEEDVHRNKSQLLLRSNPARKTVPVLFHNGEPICESQIIVQYIDEAFATASPALLPADPGERAAARFWVAYLDDKVVPMWWQLFKSNTEKERAEREKQTAMAVDNIEAAFKQLSKGKSFFGGDGVGYLDVMLGGLVSWARAGKELHGFGLFDAARSPVLGAWEERFSALAWAKPLPSGPS